MGTITLKAKETSKLISGDLQIKVNPRDISELTLSEMPIEMNQLVNINETIKTKIATLFSENSAIKVTTEDFEILDQEGHLVDLENH
jgi:citrate lyase gamma subunit